MAWKKNSADAVARFDTFAALPDAERKILFGCPVYVLDGERYATLHQDRIALRLSPADAAELLADGGDRFEPIPGRPSKDRVVLPDALAADDESLRAWIERAVRYARSTA